MHVYLLFLWHDAVSCRPSGGTVNLVAGISHTNSDTYHGGSSLGTARQIGRQSDVNVGRPRGWFWELGPCV